MRQLDEKLESLGVRHRLGIYDGPHDWPPSDLATRAAEWMELQAMKSGARPKDAALAAAWLAKASQEAAALEAAGKKGDALVRYREIAVDFDGLADVAEARAAADRLGKDRDAEAQIAKQRRLEEDEDKLFADVSGICSRICGPTTRCRRSASRRTFGCPRSTRTRSPGRPRRSSSRPSGS